MTTLSKVQVMGLLTIAICLPLLVLTARDASAAPQGGDTESAVTHTGTGRFSDLAVTVGQTTHLRNQVVRVSWTGGQQTTDLTGRFYTNYLQIMECWGDGDEPRRENCQFGGLYTDQRGGTQSTDRQVSGDIVDPLETYLQEPGSFEPARVPFEAVNGDVVTERRNEFYDAYSTNEIPFGRTAADGTGQEFFEVQTAREAPGLGCGAAEDGGDPRSCWLVVVPRDDVEVDGEPVPRAGANGLQSSPLSATNWADKISFKMSFEPLGVTCPIGSAERRLLGHESVAEAIVRWQPVLCGETGSIFGYSQLGDDLARAQVLTDTPWMSLVNRPIPPDQIADGRELTYAPVSISGLGIAFNLDRVPALTAPPAVQQTRGTRIWDLRLNARLVAKLLTQSYQRASLAPQKLAGNPLTLMDDPEFKKLNPLFKNLEFLDVYSITNPLGLSDAYRMLWQWIASDPVAKAFIGGKADPWGTTVNRYYKNLSLDREDFPRSDPNCQKNTNTADLCPLDFAAYANDLHDAGRAAARGQTLSRATWDESSALPSWKVNPPQASGERRVLSIVDTATAARYQLPMAQLLNGGGKYIAPTSTSMLAAVDAMDDPTVPGVLESNPGTKAKGAYPLTQISYAVTAPAVVSVEERKDYANFIRFVTTDGQKPGIGPGQLPEGYTPLTKQLRAQADAAAAEIAKGGTPTTAPTTTTPTQTTTAPTSPASTDPTDAGNESPPPPGSSPTVPTSSTTDVDTTPVSTVSMTTPSTPVGAWRFLIIIALLVGVLAAAAKPMTSLLVRLANSRRSP